MKSTFNGYYSTVITFIHLWIIFVSIQVSSALNPGLRQALIDCNLLISVKSLLIKLKFTSKEASRGSNESLYYEKISFLWSQNTHTHTHTYKWARRKYANYKFKTCVKIKKKFQSQQNKRKVGEYVETRECVRKAGNWLSVAHPIDEI